MTRSDYWSAPSDWRGQRCFIVCGGESVLTLDLARLRGHRVIAINSSMHTWPESDYGVFGDARWWKEHADRVRSVFQGRVIALTPMRPNPHYALMQRQASSGLAIGDRTRLALWHTTVCAAINLVVHLTDGDGECGCLGLDGSGDWHHEPHKWYRNPQWANYHDAALRAVAKDLAAHTSLRVYNCNPVSAFEMFPHRSYEEMTQ